MNGIFKWIKIFFDSFHSWSYFLKHGMRQLFNSLRSTRIAVQILFACLFLLTLFGSNTHKLGYILSSEWFLQLNPLTALTTTVASRTLFPSLLILSGLVLVLTILFGRFFCGFICPLGAFIDFSDRFLLGKKNRKIKSQPGQKWQSFKYLFLIAVILLAFTGSFFPFFLDPISICVRTVTSLVYPVLSLGGATLVNSGKPFFEAIGWDQLAFATIKPPVYYGGLGVLVVLLFIIFSGYWGRRFWCQYICPSGALFGLLSRYTLFRRHVSNSSCDECSGAHRCISKCPTRAIRQNAREITNTSECLVCGVCTNLRTKISCSSFGFGDKQTSKIVGADLRRRQVLAGIGIGAITMPVLKSDAMKVYDQHGRLIRPPGSVPESQFSAKCVGCDNCIKSCPTNTIQPCGLSDGFTRWYTPKVVPRIGGCEEKCHLCGQVCPTGAIRTLPWEEKRFVKIGTASIKKHKCLPWEQHKECLVCDEVCPYNAITSKHLMTPYGRFKVPVVDEDLCLGCGLCEHHCPIEGEAAIVVYNFSENRKAKGPYLTDKEKQETLKKRESSDAVHGEFEGAGGPVSSKNKSDVKRGAGADPYGEPSKSGGSRMPEGFDFGSDDTPSLPEGFSFED